MSTPGQTIFRVRVSRRKGVSPSKHMAFIREAIAKYKGGMYPDDPFYNYTIDDVEVFGKRRKEALGFALVCREREGFPQFFHTQTEAEQVKGKYPLLPYIRVVAMIATEIDPD